MYLKFFPTNFETAGLPIFQLIFPVTEHNGSLWNRPQPLTSRVVAPRVAQQSEVRF